MILAQGGAAQEISAAERIVQFAAIVMEMGGAVLLAVLFAVVIRASQRRDYFVTWTVGWFAMAAAITAIVTRYLLLAVLFAVVLRASQRRDYFVTWTIAWVAMAAAITAIVTRYLLLPDLPGVPQERAPLIWLLYGVYEAGKFAYWILIWRGVAEYVNPGATSSRWRWLSAAVVASVLPWLFYRDLNDLLLVQAPVAVASCVAGAVALRRMPRARQTAGSAVMALVLGVTGVIWILYLAAFGNAVAGWGIPLGGLQAPLLSYNSYVDMLLLVVLGYAMLMVFLEDASRRISHIESRLGALILSAPDPIFTIDAQQRIVAANDAAGRVFGEGARRSAGTMVTDLVEPADRDRLQEAIAAFASGADAANSVGGDEEGWLHGLRADGSRFTAEFTLSRLFDADVTAVSVLVRDMTRRHEEVQRRRQATTMEAVRQLAGGLAHDFNNLLTTIVGRSQIVARTLAPASPVREDVVQIEQAAAAAARLSRGLLALSRREPLNPERLSVDDVIRAVEPALRAAAGSRVTCTFSLHACNTWTHVDRARLEGALVALAQNAGEAMPGGGALTIETSRALLPQQFGANVEAASIVVRDTGAGLDPEARAHLFEPFFSTKGDGRGLGLATTWAFVHQSGGTVDIESGRQGTSVRLLFPLAMRAAGDEPAAPAALAIVAEVPRVRRTVLVAEDEASVRKSVRVFLERAGFTVVEAADGAEALAAFERDPELFGLLLTDVMMPQMGGRELATQVMERRPDLPIVFMSGFLRDPEVLRMVNDRRVRFLAKPFDIDALISTVRGEIERGESHVA